MIFIWRGLGFLVPVLGYLIGVIILMIYKYYDYPNPMVPIRLSLIVCGVVFLVLGIRLLRRPPQVASDGQLRKKKHDFFWIPVYIWGILLEALGIYLLFDEKLMQIE